MLTSSYFLIGQSVAIVGVLQDDVDPLVSVMKLEKAPTESYADIGGLESQIQEIKVKSSKSAHAKQFYRKQSNYP